MTLYVGRDLSGHIVVDTTNESTMPVAEARLLLETHLARVRDAEKSGVATVTIPVSARATLTARAAERIANDLYQHAEEAPLETWEAGR